MTDVTKSTGDTEAFDEEKLDASIIAACASANRDIEECEDIAEDVTQDVADAIAEMDEVETAEIRERVEEALAEVDPRLAFFYDQHIPNLNEL